MFCSYSGIFEFVVGRCPVPFQIATRKQAIFPPSRLLRYKLISLNVNIKKKEKKPLRDFQTLNIGIYYS